MNSRSAEYTRGHISRMSMCAHTSTLRRVVRPLVQVMRRQARTVVVSRCCAHPTSDIMAAQAMKEKMRGRRGSVHMQADDIHKAFKLFDLNNDGEISMREFVKIMTQKGGKCKPLTEDAAMALFKDFLIDADSNNDGKVSLEELAKAWGTGSAAAAVAAAEDVGAGEFSTIITEAVAKQLVTLWAVAYTGLGRGEAPAPYFVKLLKQDYAVTWNIIGECQGADLKDSTHHIAVGRDPEEGEITLEAFQQLIGPRLTEVSFYQCRTTPLGFEGDMVILQCDYYTREGKQFEVCAPRLLASPTHTRPDERRRPHDGGRAATCWRQPSTTRSSRSGSGRATSPRATRRRVALKRGSRPRRRTSSASRGSTTGSCELSSPCSLVSPLAFASFRSLPSIPARCVSYERRILSCMPACTVPKNAEVRETNDTTTSLRLGERVTTKIARV